MFLPPGPIQSTIFSLLGAILFSAYIVYDTDNLIQSALACLHEHHLPCSLPCGTQIVLVMMCHGCCDMHPI